MSTFRLVGLEHAQFAPLFERTDAELRSQGILRTRATTRPGYPCRISLEDAVVGDEVLLLPYAHHRVDSPYKSLGPIYIRKGVTQAVLAPGEVPDYVASRLMSLRAYDDENMMVAAQVCPGAEVAAHISRLFDDPGVAYLHLHNAAQGCFSCLANREGGP
jgi:hypothetical protein